MSPSVFGGFLFFAAVMLGHFVVKTVSSRTGETLPNNFIGFASAPDRLVEDSVVSVRYLCSAPCRLTVEVVTSTSWRTDLVVFRKTWTSSTARVFRIHDVLLRLPPSILYRHGFFNRHVLDTRSVAVRGWLDRLDDGGGSRTYHGSTLRIYKEMQVDPVSDRPDKPPTECPSWSSLLMWQIRTRTRSPHCLQEPDVVEVLTFPLASPGEHFGVVRRFGPFKDRALESARHLAATRPSVALSVWIYLLRWCQDSLCGIVHHLDRNNAFHSVLMQLSDSGDVVIQARVTTGEDKAFRANVALPRWKWIRLDCYILDSTVLLDATWDDKTISSRFQFQDGVQYDDTDGYFVIGGSRYMPGIHGYFGPVRFYRLGTERVKNQLSPAETTLQQLDQTHHECQEMKGFTRAFLRQVTKSRVLLASGSADCVSAFIRLKHRSAGRTCWQTWTWETQLKYADLFHFLQTKEEKIRAGYLSTKELRAALFEQAVATMFTAQNEVTPGSMSLLRASSCFGNHRASLLMAAVQLSGLEGGSADRQQGHVYSLISAAGGNRLALMHAGYKHTQGIDGFPEDLDMAYSYYSNAAVQSISEDSRTREHDLHPLELIYLNNQEDVNSAMHETTDVFHFLKYRAESGDLESQKHLGALLYWGQGGAPKDVASAMKWFERSALQMEDPAVMYDYSILLMKGEGVKRNYSRGFKLMEKAAEMGSVEALNGLGWYHQTVLNDYKTAVTYFERAALNGSMDGMFNLGLYHLSGVSLQRNETAAFLHFLNASRHGHATASVEAAWYLSTGSLGGVSQDVERAVIMLKKVCEQSGHLGFLVKDALQAFLQGARQEALLKYVLVAETGLGLAQSNAAHLCQELNMSDDCQWRYHNYSILNYDPHPSALLRMADHYSSSPSTLAEAVSMYSRAALAGSPQGIYNLVLLVQRGHDLPPSIHGLVQSHDGEQDVVEKLLKRCMELEEEEAVTPCSLALLRVQMGKALRRMSQSAAQLLLVYASLLSAAVLTVIVLLQIHLNQQVPAHRVFISQHGIEQRLRQACDVAVTLAGVCLCAFCTTLLFHLL